MSDDSDGGSTLHLSPFTESLALRIDLAQVTTEGRKVAESIMQYRRSKPIPLRSLVERTRLNDRAVKLTGEELIVAHGMRIGASREPPNAGYFLCISDADIEAAARPLRSTAESLLRRIKALTRPWNE